MSAECARLFGDRSIPAPKAGLPADKAGDVAGWEAGDIIFPVFFKTADSRVKKKNRCE